MLDLHMHQRLLDPGWGSLGPLPCPLQNKACFLGEDDGGKGRGTHEGAHPGYCAPDGLKERAWPSANCPLTFRSLRGQGLRVRRENRGSVGHTEPWGGV